MTWHQNQIHTLQLKNTYHLLEPTQPVSWDNWTGITLYNNNKWRRSQYFADKSNDIKIEFMFFKQKMELKSDQKFFFLIPIFYIVDARTPTSHLNTYNK